MMEEERNPKKQKLGTVTVLDYGTGNVRSLRNALHKLGYSIHDVTCRDDILKAERLIFPGVGAFDTAMTSLNQNDYASALREYIEADRPFFGICLGLQLLFDSSEEGELPGLGIIPGRVRKFPEGMAVPHMGWNSVRKVKESDMILDEEQQFYFVHSYMALPTADNAPWLMAVSDYSCRFVSVVERGRVMAAQFHPEKSSSSGLALLARFLQAPVSAANRAPAASLHDVMAVPPTQLSKRVVACLDVRTNDHGDLVVTKGDQYDVREKAGDVRNLGKPVELAHRYFEEGCDEVVFLNITSFRSCPLDDIPMLKVLEAASEEVFVPMTVGGGIRDFTDPSGKQWSAVEVADRYFRAGADKVSIGGDAVEAAEMYIKSGVKTGKTALEAISARYGAQALVVSIDPRRVYVSSPEATRHHVVKSPVPGPNGEEWCWYQCTVKGGREGRDVDAWELARACQALGAGEIMLNCIDTDGTGKGFEEVLIADIKQAVSIPIIASSGAGAAEHFSSVFTSTGVEAALAAGIFHRREIPIKAVKQHLKEVGIPTRPI